MASRLNSYSSTSHGEQALCDMIGAYIGKVPRQPSWLAEIITDYLAVLYFFFYLTFILLIILKYIFRSMILEDVILSKSKIF